MQWNTISLLTFARPLPLGFTVMAEDRLLLLGGLHSLHKAYLLPCTTPIFLLSLMTTIVPHPSHANVTIPAAMEPLLVLEWTDGSLGALDHHIFRRDLPFHRE
jgi:hypothetical protein